MDSLWQKRQKNDGQCKRKRGLSFDPFFARNKKDLTKVPNEDNSQPSWNFKQTRTRSTSITLGMMVSEASDVDEEIDFSFTSCIDSDTSIESVLDTSVTPPTTSKRRLSGFSFRGLAKAEKRVKKSVVTPVRNVALRIVSRVTPSNILRTPNGAFSCKESSNRNTEGKEAASFPPPKLSVDYQSDSDATPTKENLARKEEQANAGCRPTCSVKTSKHTRNITMPVAIGSSDLFHLPLKRLRRQESDKSFDLSGSYKNDTSIVQKKRRSDFHPLNALKSTKTTTSVQTLREFLKKKSQAMAFHAFLQKEFSEENLDFWTEVETYKKQKSSKQAKLAPVIYKTYIAVNAPKEINIDSSTRRSTTHNLQHPDNATFDLAQERVYQLMERDSFRRFLAKEWKNENEVRKSSDKLKLPAKIKTKSLTSKQEHKKSKSERLSAPEVDFSLMTEANNVERRKRKFSS
ncbi:unnamed protein product [Clavelina lepadiformis]|uniref:RGS domain-containing protein n=2 Tax=Clavelina lepadiformis TaxID=159417 RepID=A0ABP0F6A2_CLALP